MVSAGFASDKLVKKREDPSVPRVRSGKGISELGLVSSRAGAYYHLKVCQALGSPSRRLVSNLKAKTRPSCSPPFICRVWNRAGHTVATL